MANIVRLGDPHLGKVFKNGVPLHRRGEREKTQWADFERSLDTKAYYHINMGDLFDTDEVPYSIILRAALCYKRAASTHSATTYVVLRGNHDGSHEAEKISAYQVFAEILRDVPNVIVTENEAVARDGMLFVPWHPFKPAIDMIPKKGHFVEVYGHWDVRDFGDESPNLIPSGRLQDITNTVFTGHEHKPAVIANQASGFDIILTGSMQPYAHGEEIVQSKYRTLTLKELGDVSVAELHNMCLRLVLLPGESPPKDLDVLQLQLTTAAVAEDDGSIPITSVDVKDFDLKALYEASATEAGLGEPMQKKVWTYIEGGQT